MDDFGILSNEQIDALKEVGTIGAGHAANALSQLTGRKIMISVPEVKVVPLKEIVELVGPPESMVAVVYMKVVGDTQGRSLQIFPRQSAFKLVDILMKRPVGQTNFLNETDCSALKEVGNILTGSFLTTLADFLNILLMTSVPLIAYDMAGAILEVLAIEFGEEAEHVFCIQTEFKGPTSDIKGSFILVLDRKPLELIIRKIDGKIKKWR